MRAHKTQKRLNRLPKPLLLFGFWGDPVRWSRGERRQIKAPTVRRNVGLGQTEPRESTWDASWAKD